MPAISVALARAPGQSRFEDVVALVRIERPVLVAHHRLVVDGHGRAAAHIVDEVERPAEMRVPRKALVDEFLVRGQRPDQPVDGQVKVVAREEFRRCRRRTRRSAAAGRPPGDARGGEAATGAARPRRSESAVGRRSACSELLLEFGDALLELLHPLLH